MAKVVIYTVDYCPYCKKAKNLLEEKGVEYEEHDITTDEDVMRPKLGEMTGGKTTVPQIFIDGVSIGGYTDLQELDKSGKLDELLK